MGKKFLGNLPTHKDRVIDTLKVRVIKNILEQVKALTQKKTIRYGDCRIDIKRTFPISYIFTQKLMGTYLPYPRYN